MKGAVNMNNKNAYKKTSLFDETNKKVKVNDRKRIIPKQNFYQDYCIKSLVLLQIIKYYQTNLYYE